MVYATFAWFILTFCPSSIRSLSPTYSSSSIRSPFRFAARHRFDDRCQSAVRDQFAVCFLKNVEGSRDEKRDEMSMKEEERKETKRIERTESNARIIEGRGRSRVIEERRR
jgi:hypothetical protein